MAECTKMEDYIKQLEYEGYINKDGAPLKCGCGSKEFEDVNEHFCQYGREEYEVRCKSCGEIVGHWAYGYWQIQ